MIGQSRGGTLARALAVRAPDERRGLVMLGSPVRDRLAVSPPVLRTVRSVALLGDLGVPGLFSNELPRRRLLRGVPRGSARAPLGPRHRAVVAIYSRSDAIVDWRACLDPYAECVEVDSSHCGMSVTRAGLPRARASCSTRTEEAAWSG